MRRCRVIDDRCGRLVRMGTRQAARGFGLACWLVGGLLHACETPQVEPGLVPVGSIEVFEAQIEPMLERRCAQGGCHGRPDRPFVLYAPGVYRRDEARTSLAEPLDHEELASNALRVAALLDRRDVDRSVVLRKPLVLAEGGLHHGGGGVFADRGDADYVLLRRWLLSCASREGI